MLLLKVNLPLTLGQSRGGKRVNFPFILPSMRLLGLHHLEIFPRASGLRGILAFAEIKWCSLLQVPSLLSSERHLHLPKQPSLQQPELQVGRKLTCHPALSFSHLFPFSVSLWGKFSVSYPLRYKEPMPAELIHEGMYLVMSLSLLSTSQILVLTQYCHWALGKASGQHFQEKKYFLDSFQSQPQVDGIFNIYVVNLACLASRVFSFSLEIFRWAKANHSNLQMKAQNAPLSLTIGRNKLTVAKKTP